MSSDLQRSRPRLRSSRHEALLRGVERRSIQHISQLSNLNEFPKDEHDAPIILQTVMKLLDAEPTPMRPHSQYSPAGEAVKKCLHCVFGWMDILCISIRKLSSDRSIMGVALEIHQQYLDVALRWLKFYMREKSWIFTVTAYYEYREDLAPRLISETLTNLYAASNHHPLGEAMQESEDVVDLLLAIWMWEDKNGNALYLQYSASFTQGKVVLCPIIRVFASFCINHNSLMVLEKMSALTRRERTRFMRCTVSRVEQWRPPPRDSDLLSRPTMPINGLETLMMAITAVVHFIPEFAKPFTRSNLAVHALRQAQLYGSDLPSIGSASASFATKSAYSLFHTKDVFEVADLRNQVVCQLLEAGVLNVFLDYMFSEHAANPRAHLFKAASRNRDVTEQNPLASLAPLCVHRRVCEATCTAIAGIAASRMEVLTSGWAAEYWKPFYDTVRLYEHIWARVPKDRVVLCDNFKHSPPAGPLQPAFTAKECSHCRAVVYCSPTCQEQDWDNHGGKECTLLRAYRIERELHSAWISHRTRTFYFYLLQQLLLNLELGLPIESTSGAFSEDQATLTYTHPAPEFSDKPTQHPSTVNHVFKFDTTHMSCQVSVQTAEEVVKSRFAAEIEKCLDIDSRSQQSHVHRFDKLYRESLEAMVGSSDKGDDQAPSGKSSRRILGLCRSLLGVFNVTVFGRFILESGAQYTRVILLNGYVRVEPRDEEYARLI